MQEFSEHNGKDMVNQGTALIAAETAKQIQEIQASLVIAKRFPRVQNHAYNRIMTACKRKSLAENALYAYPRGSQMVTGPSIRLAEMIAQNWGNMDFGIRELSQSEGVSEVEAYAWDVETNTRTRKIFQVKHIRYSRNKGNTELYDPRDIYEMTANQGARRLRACILAVIPGDIVEAAVEQCEKTMNGVSDEPLEDRIKKMIYAFKELGITQKMLEERLGHKMEATLPAEITSLKKIYKSLKDGMAGREDFFNVNDPYAFSENDDLEEKLRQARRSPTPEKGDNGKKVRRATKVQKATLQKALSEGQVAGEDAVGLKKLLENGELLFREAQEWMGYLESQKS